MRMPIFSYFIVVGAVLTGLLMWLGDDGDLQSAPLRTSQQVGMPKPFKGKPETMVDITHANFAAPHERASAERAPEKPAKVAAEPKPRHKPKAVARAEQPNWQPNWQPSWEPAARNSYASYPQDNLMGLR
jgi:hypothetical protein